MALPLLPIVAVAGGVYVAGRALEAGGKAAVTAFKNRKNKVVIPDTAKNTTTTTVETTTDTAPKASPSEPSAEAAPAASPAPATADAEGVAGASADDALKQAEELAASVEELQKELETFSEEFTAARARSAAMSAHARKMASLAAMAAASKDFDELVEIRRGVFDATEEAALACPDDAGMFTDVAADVVQAVNLRIEEVGYQTAKAAEPPPVPFKSKAELKAEKAALRAEKRKASGKPA